jgi:hypothetical protein
MSPPRLLPAVLGGLFLGVLSALPIVGAANACCCLWVVVGGVLAAWLMQQNHPAPITLADGALVGLLAGVVGAVVMMIVSVPIGYLTGGGQPFSTAMVPPEGLTPEMREVLSRIGPGVVVALAAIMWIGASLVFSTVGGLLGAAIFRRPSPPVGPPPVPPPMPPVVPPPAPPATSELPSVPPAAPAPTEPAAPDASAVPSAPATPPLPEGTADDRPSSSGTGGPDGPFERPISGESDPDRRG